MTEPSSIIADDASLKSTFYEQLVEHVFVSEILQEAWYFYGKTVEVLRSKVDASGYDVVFDCNGVLRHVHTSFYHLTASRSRLIQKGMPKGSKKSEPRFA